MPQQQPPSSLISVLYSSSTINHHEADCPSFTGHVDYANSELHALQRHKVDFPIPSAAQIANIIAVLQEHVNASFTQIMALIPGGPISDQLEKSRTIDIVMRMWLTINVQTTKPIFGPAAAHVNYCEWNKVETPAQFLERVFSVSKGPDRDSRQIDSALTVPNLTRRRHLRISWTNNLLNHLRLEGDVLTIYKHKICMDNQVRLGEASILPAGLAEETIDTFNLLFPFPSAKTKKFLEREQQPFHSLGQCKRPVQWQLDHYVYWGQRLQDLCNLYESPPKNMRQVLFDRRRLLETATFWLAITVAALTVASIVTGALSTDYSKKQYELALAQACLIDNATLLLPQFCR